jgi:hypothetical protein
MLKKYRVIRDVTYNECSWLDRDFIEGEILYEYTGYTYGCISSNGIALTESQDGGEPFFEFPYNAVEEM